MAAIVFARRVGAEELHQLSHSGLADSDVKRFYVELTAIVRRYIERTTGIRAPEQTTKILAKSAVRTPSRVKSAASYAIFSNRPTW